MVVLGSPQVCEWRNSFTLQVVLGRNATVLLGDAIAIRSGALVPAGNVAFLPVPSLKTTVSTNDTLPSLSAKLLASPALASPCDSVNFHVRNISGQTGRAVLIEWAFGSKTLAPVVQALEDLLEQANALGSTDLEVSSARFKAAMDTARAVLGDDAFNNASIQLEVVARITNWLGAMTNVSARVEMDRGPLLEAATAFTLNVPNSAHVEFAIKQRALNTSKCPANFSDADRGVKVQWQHRAAEQSTWDDLADVGYLQDTARSPYTVRFVPTSFQPNTQHEFRAIAEYTNAPTGARPRIFVFTLNVGPRELPVAALDGPSQTSSRCGFTLTAESSRDPSLSASSKPNFAYEWFCQSDVDGEPCDSLPNFGAGSRSRIDGSGTAGPTLVIAGGHLTEGIYSFAVRVWRRSVANDTGSTAFLNVSIKQGAPPPITIFAPWTVGQRVSTQTGGSLGVVQAHVEGTNGCPVSKLSAWQWTLMEGVAPFRILAFLETSVTQDDTRPAAVVSTSAFRGSLLVPGSVYVYAMLLTSTANVMNTLMASDALNLTGAVSAGAFVTRSLDFLADGPPSAGHVEVSPLSGEAVITKFSLTAHGWKDEQVTTLQYAFFAFPQPTGATGTSDLVADATANTTAIEWINASHPQFWTRLGGLALRTWSSETVIHSVRLSPGSYFLAVRVRDELGGTSTALTSGPNVKKPVGGISAAAASDALKSALSSNDADTVLNSVASVSSVSVTGNAQATGAVVNASMNAIEVAVELLQPSSEGLQKLGQVLANTLKSDKSGVSVIVEKDILSRASDVMGAALDAVLDGDGSIKQDASDALLSSLTAIGAGNAASDTLQEQGQGVQSLEESAAISDKVVNLVSKLGQAMLNSIPIGGSQAAISINADGTGSRSFVEKADAVAAQSTGLSAGGLLVPSSALGNDSRRLEESELPRDSLKQRRAATSCGSFGVQISDWLSSNPFGWANASLGLNRYVLKNATVKVVEVTQCNSALSLAGATLRVDLDLHLLRNDDGLKPACLFFNRSTSMWTSMGLSAEPPVANHTSLTCLSTLGAGPYTVVYLLAPLKSDVDVTHDPTSDLDLAIAIPFVILGAVCSAGGTYYCYRVCAASQRRHKTKVASMADGDAQKNSPSGDQAHWDDPVVDMEKHFSGPRQAWLAEDCVKVRIDREGHNMHASSTIDARERLPTVMEDMAQQGGPHTSLPGATLETESVESVSSDEEPPEILVKVTPFFADWAREWSHNVQTMDAGPRRELPLPEMPPFPSQASPGIYEHSSQISGLPWKPQAVNPIAAQDEAAGSSSGIGAPNSHDGFTQPRAKPTLRNNPLASHALARQAVREVHEDGLMQAAMLPKPPDPPVAQASTVSSVPDVPPDPSVHGTAEN